MIFYENKNSGTFVYYQANEQNMQKCYLIAFKALLTFTFVSCPSQPSYPK